MSQDHTYQTTLPSLPEGVSRPLWSVMIPTYNCAAYLRETLTSVLAQDPGADVMQIEVVDDHSTKDDPAAVVEKLGRGRVGFYQQPQNVGHTRNFQTCLERSRGQLIHLLHGDDAVRNGFYHKMQVAFANDPAIGAAFCRCILMDDQSHWQSLVWLERSHGGILDNWLERSAVEQRIQTPSIVVRREVYETLGTFDRRLSWTEDWEMWVRIAAHYPVWYEPEPLALYRIHDNSSTGRHTVTGKNMEDVRRAIEIFQDYLPEGDADRITSQASENWALEAIGYAAPNMLAVDNVSAAIAQVREGLKCSHSLKVIKKLPPLVLQIGKKWLKKKITMTQVTIDATADLVHK